LKKDNSDVVLRKVFSYLVFLGGIACILYNPFLGAFIMYLSYFVDPDYNE